MSNCIVIPAYNGIKDKFSSCIRSWEIYAERHKIDLIVHSGPVNNNDEGSQWELSIWRRWQDLKLLLNKHDNFLQVDADTMIRWDAPNIFNECSKESEISGVLDGMAGFHHFPQWSMSHNLQKINFNFYFNAGLLRFSKKFADYLLYHLETYYSFWKKRKSLNIKIDAVDQTAVNLIIQQSDLNFEILPLIFNNLVLNNYNDFNFIEENYVWHFTGPNMGGWANKENIINQTWDKVKSNYFRPS